MYGHGVVRGMFETIDGENLRGFAVWLPMMSGDDAEAAQKVVDAFPDPRVSHAWDPNRVLGDLAAQCLGLAKTGWDLYLVYPAGVVWEGDALPTPELWMAQLPSEQGIGEQTLLDPGRLAAEVYRMTGREENRDAVDLKLSLHARGLMEVRNTGEAFQAFLTEVGFDQDLGASC